MDEQGLGYCDVCKGAEASLTTDCCGRKITESEDMCIMGGTLDYVKGNWITYKFENKHFVTQACHHGDSCQETEQACVFTICKVCGCDDSTKEGEEQLNQECKGRRV